MTATLLSRRRKSIATDTHPLTVRTVTRPVNPPTPQTLAIRISGLVEHYGSGERAITFTVRASNLDSSTSYRIQVSGVQHQAIGFQQRLCGPLWKNFTVPANRRVARPKP